MAPHSSTLAWKIPWTEEPVGCSPWGREESDTTEQLPFHFSLSCIGEGNGNPLQCSCLENPRDGGAWWAAIYGVAQSRTWLSDLAAAAAESFLIALWLSLWPTVYLGCWVMSTYLWNFPNFLLLLISNFIPLVREYTLYNFNPFKFIETCFMAQDRVCLGTRSFCTWGKCVFCW